ncbi:MAG: hypothetical protein R6U43_11125 [Candidatus Krumholzibacteriales bacterium]
MQYEEEYAPSQVYDFNPLAPKPPREDINKEEELGIIRGLDVNKDINEIILELQGQIFFTDPQTNKQRLVLKTEPIMNSIGIQNFITSLKSISKKVVTFSNYSADEVNPRIKAFVYRNYTHFLAHSDEFELQEKHYNLIMNYLFAFADGAYHKAKGAGDRNVIRATYSEDLLMKQAGINNEIQGGPEKKGFFSKLFGRR